MRITPSVAWLAFPLAVTGCTVPGVTVATTSEARVLAPSGPNTDGARSIRVIMHEPDRADEKIRELLRRQSVKIDFSDTPAEDVFKWFQDRLGVPVYVDWRALGAKGIERETPVSLRLANVPLGVALDLVLNELAERNALVHGVSNGMVHVARPRESGRWAVVRVYDCAGLIEPTLTDVERAALRRAIEEWAKVSARADTPVALKEPPCQGTMCFSARVPDQYERRIEGDRAQVADRILYHLRERRSECLLEVIVSLIAPDSWEEWGGLFSATCYGRHLVIRNTPTVHSQIESLLNVLLSAQSN